MATKRKGLGRGLDALLGGSTQVETKTDTAATKAPAESVTQASELPVEAMKRGRYQPRIDMRKESLEELAQSIRAQGLIQPIIVRPLKNVRSGEPTHEIIAGERRWRAAQMAGLADVPVAIRDVDDEAAMAMALIENIQREDLNPLEEAEALKRLVAEFDLTHEEAAQAVGRSRAAVSNLMRLTELGPDVQDMLRARQIDMGHARALLAVSDIGQQLSLARECRDSKLTVRALEAKVRALRGGTKNQSKKPKAMDPNIRALTNQLSETLNAEVTVTPGKGGSGKLVISYHNLDALEGILSHIK